MRWDPEQYARFSGERSRPFADLIARVGAETPRRVVDLGCGPGSLTLSLARRWPGAAIEGIDSSPEMIEQAQALVEPRLFRPATPEVSFALGDLTAWRPGPDVDVVVSNAALQWVPGPLEVLSAWAADLPAGGWLAVQVPGNFDAPSHALLRELAESPRWKPLLGGRLRPAAMAAPEEYALRLYGAGLVADVWETTYRHRLSGPDPVLEWMRGTALRPVLDVLDEAQAQEFTAELGARLGQAYPPTEYGTLLPFRRIFAVGHRR